MQEIAEGADDPVAMLSSNGIFTSESAVYYLTPSQLRCVFDDLTEMEETLTAEIAAWTLSYKLSRARIANKKFSR